MRQLDFGVFDHVDRGGRTVKEVFDLRMRLIETYEAAGFHAYHPAEHHSTPLSCSPSPNLLIAACAQRTSRIRLAPLVYLLPMYQPLRLLEEICMLDHMTGGRFEMGVGKGIAPFELMGWGINPLEAMDRYVEVLDILRIGLTTPDRKLTYRGRYHHYVDVPIELEPLQRPHPPLWYGVWKDPAAAVWPAQNNCNIAAIIGSAAVRPLVDRFTEEWNKAHGGSGKPFPKTGLTRTVVVAPTDAEARARAEKAHMNYWESLDHLWHRWGAANAHFPHDFEGAAKMEMIIWGSPESVRQQVEEQTARSGVNYLIGRFAYGDMPDEQIEESIGLFAESVMPCFRGGHLEAAE